MGALTQILVGIGTSFLATELFVHSGSTARWLIKRAARRLPKNDRERAHEEWIADLNDMPGAVQKLLWAIGCHWAATVANFRDRRKSKKAAFNSRTISFVARTRLDISYFERSAGFIVEQIKRSEDFGNSLGTQLFRRYSEIRNSKYLPDYILTMIGLLALMSSWYFSSHFWWFLK